MKRYFLLTFLIWIYFNSYSQTVVSEAKISNTINQIKGEMVLVSGGSFRMGCSNTWGSPCYDFEKANANVTLTTFYIGKFDVTQAEWEVIMGSNPSYFNKCPSCPVENVSWNDAQKFIETLNHLSGRHYHLPTEAQWEYAARGGAKTAGNYFEGADGSISWNDLTEQGWQTITGTKLANFTNCGDCLVKDLTYSDARFFISKINKISDPKDSVIMPDETEWSKQMVRKGYKFAGSNRIDDVAWYYSNSNYMTHPVGLKKPNELGLYDMTGNVSQWCSDWFDLDYQIPNPSSDPTGIAKGLLHAVRGLPWWMSACEMRVTMRYGSEPDYRLSDTGFRLALEP